MTITSAVTPHWISYSETTKLGGTVYDRIGLRQRCSTSTASGSASGKGCAHFPDEGQCGSGDRYAFCSMWRTTGFLMSFAVVMNLVTLVSLLVIMAGGKARRESGWRAVCGMLAAVAALQFGAMAVVVSCPSFRGLSRNGREMLIWAVHACRVISSTMTTSSMSLGMRWMRRGISVRRAL
jgi:hypothetical protein